MIKPYSKSMFIFNFLKLKSIAWSLRRWFVPVAKNDLVLEIGSGGNPYFRSNVLCDADIRSEDHFQKLVSDRPLIIAYGEELPFKDNSLILLLLLMYLNTQKNLKNLLRNCNV